MTDGNMWLNRTLLDLVYPVGLLKNVSRLGKTLLNITHSGLNVMADIMGGIIGSLHIRLIMDNRSSLFDGFILIKNCRQHLVGYLDQFDRPFCNFQ